MIQQETYMRLALVLQNSNAHTVKTNIVKIIRATFIENNNNPINLTEASKLIADLYSLEFEPSELYAAIKDVKYEGFEIVDDDDPIYTKFSLTPEKFEKVKHLVKNDMLEDIIRRFLLRYKEESIAFVDCKNSILLFLYQTFASDADTIRALLNSERTQILENQNFVDFSNAQKALINDFLNWQDSAKDEFVFSAVSCGFEFCMLGMKKDNNSFSNIFFGKKFYLDSNLIFRLMGLNKIERQTVIRSFIDKCKQAGIILKYTNFTVGEIESTIDYHVKKIQQFYKSSHPLSRKSLEELSDKYANLDFLIDYGEWAKSPTNRVGDYNSFSADLKKRIHLILDEFQIEVRPILAKDTSKKDEYANLCAELTQFKKERYKSPYQGSIRVDVENYMFIMNLYSKHNGTSVVDVNEYFITADHSLVDWARERVPNVLPVFNLPSVWYSLLLKMRGRSDNDYRAFSQFLNLRLSEQGEDNTYKTQALQMIVDMSETASNKEAIIYEVSRLLKDSTNHYEDVSKLVDDGIQSAINQKVESAVNESTEKHAQNVTKLQSSHDTEIENVANKKYTEGLHAKEQDILAIIENQAQEVAKKIRKRSIIKLVLFFSIGVVIGIAALIISMVFYGTIWAAIGTFVVPNILTLLTFFINLGFVKKWKSSLDIKQNEFEYITEEKKKYNITI